MFNVYPCMIHYTHTKNKGILKGIPLRCSFGVESTQAGTTSFEQLKRNNPDDLFTDFLISFK